MERELTVNAAASPPPQTLPHTQTAPQGSRPTYSGVSNQDNSQDDIGRDAAGDKHESGFTNQYSSYGRSERPALPLPGPRRELPAFLTTAQEPSQAHRDALEAAESLLLLRGLIPQAQPDVRAAARGLLLLRGPRANR